MVTSSAMTKRQKGKGSKRLRQWHRTRSTGRAAAQVLRQLPAVDSGADPIADCPPPVPNHLGAGKRVRGVEHLS